MTMDHEELTGPIIGAAIEVHRELGLRAGTRGRAASEVGLHRLDLFVLDQVVVELKDVQELSPEHYAVVRSYLPACKRDLGLLLNLAKVIQRVYARSAEP